MSLTWYFIHPGLILRTSPVRFRLCDSHASWILVCLYSTVLGTGSRDSRCFTPFTGDPAVFFLKPPPLEGGRVCSGGGTVLACQPAGIYIHERARVSARARAWSYYTACPARDDGEKLEQYSSEREEEAHTHTRVVPEKPPQSSDDQYIIFFVKLHRISKFCW